MGKVLHFDFSSEKIKELVEKTKDRCVQVCQDCGHRFKEDTAEIGNFVEVKKSIVKPGAKAKHLTYLGDTTVGKKTNIGAGTITANFDGKNKFPTYIGDNCYIGSNTVLIAPLKLGKGVKTGSGAIVTRNQVIPANSLLVGVPARIIKKIQ